MPIKLEYGSMDKGRDIHSGFRLAGELSVIDRSIPWGLVYYHGEANGVDHLSIVGNRVNPVLPNQDSLVGFIQVPVRDFNVRLGGIHHWQDNGDDFIPFAVELERFWEGGFKDGDNLFLELGI